MHEKDTDLDENDAAFGGDGVRARTSTAFRVSEDSDEEIAEVEAAAVADDTSVDAVGAADEEEDEVVPLLLIVRVSALEGGDEDLDRGTTSTTFNAEEDEEDDVVEDRDSMLDTGGGIEDIEDLSRAQLRGLRFGRANSPHQSQQLQFCVRAQHSSIHLQLAIVQDVAFI